MLFVCVAAFADAVGPVLDSSDAVLGPGAAALTTWLTSSLTSIHTTLEALVQRGVTPNLVDLPCDAPGVLALARTHADLVTRLGEVRGAEEGVPGGASDVVGAWCDRLVAHSEAVFGARGDAWCAATFLTLQQVSRR